MGYKSKMNKNIIPIFIGVGIYFSIYYLSTLFENLLISQEIIKIDFNKNVGLNTWNDHPLLVLVTILNTLIFTLPCYVTGWLSKTSGTLSGFIVALVSSLIQVLLLNINWNVGFFSFYLIAHSIWVWFQSSFFTIVIGAISGAAGECHYQKRVKLITRHSTRTA